MMMSNERLRLIGRMIGIYREERRANSQNCWTQKRFCKDICSPNTLKSIENGGLARSIEVYIELLDKFDLKLGEFTAIDEAVNKLTNKLYVTLDYYRIDEAIIILNKILRILDKVSDYVYYSELKVLFESVYDYYKHEILIDYFYVERFKQMMYILPDIFSDLYRFLVYAKIKACGIGNISIYKTQVDEISLINCNSDFVKLGLIDYYYITNCYFKMKELISELEIEFLNKNNIIRLFDIYECAIILLSKTEFEKCLNYIDKAEKLIAKTDIPIIKIGELYSNIAVAFQINSHFEQALYYYEKMIENGCCNYIDSLIFMADCQNHLDQTVNIPLVKEETYSQYPTNVKLMYKYFTLGSEYPDFSKENYILKKIVPDLTDEEYIKVFRFELLRLVNNTSHYKAIHTFESKIKGNKFKE